MNADNPTPRDFADTPFASQADLALATVGRDLRRASEDPVDGAIALIDDRAFATVLIAPIALPGDGCGADR